MWSKTHMATAQGVTATQIWQIWSDINNRHLWDLDTEWARLDEPFKTGAIFEFKPKGGPKLRMQIVECIPNKMFVDCFKFPFAKLYGIHQIQESDNGLCISTTIKIVGPLSWLWRKIMGEKIAATVPEQTDMMLQLAKQI